MSSCALPGWSSSTTASALEERQTLTHLNDMLHDSALGSLTGSEVEELIWENGNVAMCGHGEMLHLGPTRAGWGRSNDSLECIVHQATGRNRNLIDPLPEKNPNDCSSSSPSSEFENRTPSLAKRRKLPEMVARGKLEDNHSIATVCRDYDGSDAVGLTSFDSLPSFSAKTLDDDSAYCLDESENQEQEEDVLENKKDTSDRSQSTKKRRTAAVHNLSERKRRERINQKMKALQKLVPNASKTDKASMLDEVIEYMKQLQAQICLLRTLRTSSPQFVMPIGMQQQLQMSLMAASGGMFDIHQTPLQPFYPFMHPAMANSAQTFIPTSHLVVPPLAQQDAAVSQAADPCSSSASQVI